MARIVVVADDLTGANATGGLFAEHGFSTVTLLDERGLNGALDRYDIVCLSTGSRHLDPDEASERVRRAVASGEDVSLVVKRIDTTLRGNVGAEIEAALGAAPTRRRALIVPAFPAAGRTTEGGLQLLDGVPLAETEAARDPLSPVTSSRVVDVVTGRSDLELAELTGADLRDRDALERALSSGPVGVVCDAGDDDDLAAIAAAAVAVAARTGVEWMSVDPGPFGPHLAAALGLRGSAARSRPEQPAPRLGPLVIACGSVTARTLEQLAHIEEVLAARFVHLDIAELDSRAAGTELLRLLERAPVDGVVGVRTAAAASDVRSIDGAGARRVLDCLAAVLRAALDEHPVGGLYLTGGDVTHAVLDALAAEGMVIDEEVLPLAVRGRVLGGPFHGLPVATKGGLVGDRAAGAACVRRLRMHTVTT